MRFDHTWDTIQLTDVLKRLWSQRPKGKPLMGGVTLFELIERRGSTTSLFGELNEVVDRLNSALAVARSIFGGAQPALDSAPMRIV